MKKFIILSTQRTGSTLFRLWLNSHESIRCHGEVFYPGYRAGDGLRKFCERKISHGAAFLLATNRPVEKLGIGIFPDFLLKRYLEKLFAGDSIGAPWTDVDRWNEYNEICTAKGQGAVGFKIMYDHLALFSGLKKWIRDEKIHIINLYRENVLKTYLSRLRSRKTGTPHAGTAAGTVIRIRVDPFEFKLFHASVKEQEIYHKNLFPDNPGVSVVYEAFIRDPAPILKKTTRFLGLEEKELLWPDLTRRSSGNLSMEIENYDELSIALKGTQLSGYLT